MLKIEKGGKLLYKGDNNKWVDVTEGSFQYLFDECTITKGTTLKDIFLLIQANIVAYEAILGNWTTALVTEGLTKPGTPAKELKYLQLYWYGEVDKYKNQCDLGGLTFPQFHAIGKEDSIPYSLSFTSPSEIIHLPVTLKDELSITDWSEYDLAKEPPKNINKYSEKHTHIFKGVKYTLGNILYGIMWELSFNGSPEDRDTSKKELLQNMEKVIKGE